MDSAWEPAAQQGRRIIVRTEATSEGVRLSVIDNGPGIAAELQARIFEPLFTTKSFGVGLGLPMVKQVVEQHQGTIAVESTVGSGTTFSILLPRHDVGAVDGTAREIAA